MEEASEGEGDLAIVQFTAHSGATVEAGGLNVPSDASGRSRTQSVIFLDRVDAVSGAGGSEDRPSRSSSVDSDNNDRMSNPLVQAPTKVVAYADNELIARGEASNGEMGGVGPR